MIEGIKRQINGREYVVPGLTMGQLRNGALAKMKESDELIEAGQTWEALPLRAEVIAIALRRNYPDLTDEIVLNEMIDSRNVLDLWSIVLGGTGIAPSAEAQAGPLATTSGPSTDS